MSQIDAKTIFDLRPCFPNGGEFTSGEARDIIARERQISPEQLDMTEVFAAIAALHQRQGEVRVDGGKYVFTPLPPPPVIMAGFNW